VVTILIQSARLHTCGMLNGLPDNGIVSIVAMDFIFEWFARQWDRFNCGNGFHIRRVHYRMISHGDVFLPDGTPYENTDECWALLSRASKFARILGMVDAELFVDRRNPGLSEFASNEITAPWFW